jgi:diguanylate cyclase (GGDEF)-like protein
VVGAISVSALTLQTCRDWIYLLISRKKGSTALREIMEDPMTSSKNRRAFSQDVSKAISQARRHNSSVALLALDLDGLKPINDTFGHDDGDKAIHSLTNAVRSVLREEDTLYRLGGDEFAVLLPECDAEGGRVILDRARAVLEAEINPFKIGVSGGVAVYPHDGKTADELEKVADARLYENKRGRKHRPQPVRPQATQTLLPLE